MAKESLQHNYIMSNRSDFCQQVTFLNTSDLAAAADFYGCKLGLPLTCEVVDFVHIYQVSADAHVGNYSGTPPMPPHHPPHPCVPHASSATPAPLQMGFGGFGCWEGMLQSVT